MLYGEKCWFLLLLLIRILKFRMKRIRIRFFILFLDFKKPCWFFSLDRYSPIIPQVVKVLHKKQQYFISIRVNKCAEHFTAHLTITGNSNSACFLEFFSSEKSTIQKLYFYFKTNLCWIWIARIWFQVIKSVVMSRYFLSEAVSDYSNLTIYNP